VEGTRSSFRTIAVLTLIPFSAFLLFVAWTWISGLPSEEALTRPSGSPLPEGEGDPSSDHPLPLGEGAAERRVREIVLILDDVGFDHQPLERAMRIDPSVNFAVLPNGTRAGDFARALNERGFEILCHLPMEPFDRRHTPGHNAITTAMSEEEIESVTRKNVEAVPYARGVNNHMGSRATADRRVMASVLAALPRGMYFIDSVTSGRSIAGSLAREMSIRTASRHVFLDSVTTEAAVRRQVASLAYAAETRGMAVAIGHLNPVTVKVLEEEIPKLRARGYRLVRASDAVN
jgi:polysaccharide deacetylase 2 family uncharacterized protein YibQ